MSHKIFDQSWCPQCWEAKGEEGRTSAMKASASSPPLFSSTAKNASTYFDLASSGVNPLTLFQASLRVDRSEWNSKSGREDRNLDGPLVLSSEIHHAWLGLRVVTVVGLLEEPVELIE